MRLTEAQEVAEYERAARIEAAKDRLRLMQAVLVAFVEGKGCSDTALGITMPSTGHKMSRETAWRYRSILGLETGRGNNGHTSSRRRGGRRDTKAMNRAVER